MVLQVTYRAPTSWVERPGCATRRCCGGLDDAPALHEAEQRGEVRAQGGESAASPVQDQLPPPTLAEPPTPHRSRSRRERSSVAGSSEVSPWGVAGAHEGQIKLLQDLGGHDDA